VYYENPEKIIVGQEAKRQYYERLAERDMHIFKSIKRLLKEDKTYSIFGKPVHDTEIASMIFHALKKRTEAVRQKDISSAVVTIPVYFDADQRKSVRKAAELAGIDIRGFLHEPIAAAYKFCQGIDYTQHILVVDWGGGTLDISLLKVDQGMVSELEVGGDEQLGGDDIDQNLAENEFALFLRNHQMSDRQLSKYPVAHQRLIASCEGAKINLSDPTVDKTPIELVNFFESQDLSHMISQERFEKSNDPIFEMVKKSLYSTMDKAKFSLKAIDQVILVGGSSRIPHFVRIMEGIFGAPKIKTLPNADTCVAEGAALMSHKGFEPVVSVPIGIKFAEGIIYKVIEKGSSLLNFKNHEINLQVTGGDNIAQIPIFESASGDPEAPDSRLKETITLPVSQGWGQEINVKFIMDENQCLTITASGNRTGYRKTVQIKDIKMGFQL